MEEKVVEKIADIVLAQVGLFGLVVLGIGAIGLTMWRESRKLREELRYQLSRDLLDRRAVCYGALWERMSLVAIYGVGRFEPDDVSDLRKELTAWYFSDRGGLFMSKRARDFYFALQKLLTDISKLPEWSCKVRPDDPKTRFQETLEKLGGRAKTSGQQLPGVDDQGNFKLDHEDWKQACALVVSHLREAIDRGDSNAGEEVFVSVQQVSSVLRTVLAEDVRSRLDVDLPA